ncbi:MAG TPA: hypothetical protein PKO36_04430 [Candidatus Hydrogenedentes bacterium]|nr:hypothetical protein [Candidatus Hydrogenedentota bacterium]HOV75356.1 hypothetical protein [Candidatus Hydrogenedentota bacterium]HPC15600.1 hypothetical protein [Candidatus Hydrogenedentota bacterium]HRT19420.1 hypothetical protein [Candidatus Hydrogenedentota bacterium]HRT63846.1 hypothetical protein [Candidatus Hydrogenedentota bacterium]
MKVIQVIMIIMLSVIASSAYALRSIVTEGFTDSDYKGYIPKKVVLLVDNASNSMRKEIEESVKEQLEKAGVTVVLYRDLFPPTREWTEEDEKKVFLKEEIDSGIIVSFGAKSQSQQNVGTHTFSTAKFNSFGASGSSTSVNINRVKSTAEFCVVMKDIKTMKTAWYADITTKAGGSLFVGELRDARAVAKGLIDGLRKNGHLPEAAKK